jgi:hypothetical protein
MKGCIYPSNHPSFKIEDTKTLSLALAAYQNARQLYGNKLVANAKRVLREFELTVTVHMEAM